MNNTLHSPRVGPWATLMVTATLTIASISIARAQQDDVEWRSYSGNLAAQRYSPLDLIDARNVTDLEVAWRWYTSNYGPRPERRNQSTPIMVDGVLYTTVGPTRNVVALDAVTGETLWLWRPEEGERFEAAPRRNSGRGVAYWTDDEGDERIILITPGFHLIALDANTGRLIDDFGDGGIVDMMVGVRGTPDPASRIGNTSPALIMDDTIIVGPAHLVSMRPQAMHNFKGDVRGFDVRTGGRLWTFHTIPELGEPGYDTWLDGSAEYTGNAGVWAPMAADPETGLVYLPTEAPLSDRYGGHRPGNNLFGNSLVALDARTGEMSWYYQLIHHDIWDWDNPTAPILMDLTVDGHEIPAVVQVTKQAFAYTFDRTTGEPVWPIEERAVPSSDIPGEWTATTQPFPTRPPPFDRQGFSEDDLIDFTPELRVAALEAVKDYRMGPIYTPPSLTNAPDGTRGTLSMPGALGGANWEAAAFDPDTQILYVGSHTSPSILAMASEPDYSDLDYIVSGGMGPGPRADGLPIVKPPWGRITAFDMNEGEILWTIPNGPTPEEYADHPALTGVPDTGRPTRPMVLATESLLFTAEGWGGRPVLRAHDKSSGNMIAEVDLPGAVGGLPMTYAVDGRQFIVVSVAGEDAAEFVALALPLEN